MAYLDSIDYAVNSAIKQTQEHYSPVVSDLLDTVRSLASKNRSLKDEVKELRVKLAADTKSTTSQPKSTFKGSPALQAAIAKASALQQSLDKALAQEQQNWEQQQIQSINRRTKKLLAENEYKQALAGSYQDAMSAIQRRKNTIAQTGVECFGHMTGSFKADFDPESLQLFTFTQIMDSTVDIAGSTYAISKAVLSGIDAGHSYTMRYSSQR